MENREYNLEVLKKLYQRNQKERKPYEDLMLLNQNQYESLDRLRLENCKLIVSNDKLQNFIDSGSHKSGNKNLLKRIRKQNRKYAENLNEKEKEIAAKKSETEQLQGSLTEKGDLLERVQKQLADKENQLQFIKDEYESLQSTFSSMEEKMQKLEKATSSIQVKAEEAVQTTSEKELLTRKEEAELKKELEEVAKVPAAIDARRISIAPVDAMLPKKVKVKAGPYRFGAHESEVNAVAWTHTGLFATAGDDRQVKMWEFISGQMHLQGVANENNSSICSIDFDTQENLILAASTDGACQIRTIKDMKFHRVLLGHKKKVMSAKFLDESDKVVSGSYDRTLKIWDLRSRDCIRSIDVGSSVNDVVTSFGYGTNIISGHYDKKIRFWDIRANSCSNNEILLQGRITSLDLSPDGYSLLSSVRDDCLQLIDVRMMNVVRTFTSDGFIIGCDFTRAKLSRDGQFCICGSQDGGIYIWFVSTGVFKKVLREHRSTVTACAWSWCGQHLVSCDRSGNVILWFENCF